MEDLYPDEFPQTSRGRLSRERIRATRDFDSAKEQVHSPSKIENLLLKYVLRVFIVFVGEARALCDQGLWTADRLESESLTFLRRFTVDARFEKGYERSGSRLREVVSHWGDLLPAVQFAFERSPEWQELQGILLEVADTQASRQEAQGQLEPRNSEPAPAGGQQTDWENITITFLSDERVEVEALGGRETRNYAEMGFQDKRSGKPNQGWGVLRALAQTKGVIPSSARNSIEFIAMAKRIERMRRTLRQHFGIPSDPVPLDPVRGYCCRFQIGCAASFGK